MANRVLIVTEHDGRTEVYADPDVTVTKVEPWNPDEYDEGTVEEQVQRTVPYLYEELYRADRHKKTATPRPYQRVVPLREKHWLVALIEFLIVLDYHFLAWKGKNPDLLLRLKHMLETGSFVKDGFFQTLFAYEYISQDDL